MLVQQKRFEFLSENGAECKSGHDDRCASYGDLLFALRKKMWHCSNISLCKEKTLQIKVERAKAERNDKKEIFLFKSKPILDDEIDDKQRKQEDGCCAC